jgi:type II secretory pathway component PulJ
MSVVPSCRSARASRRPSRAGFTLVEALVSVSIFSVVGYALAVALDVGHDSQRTVIRIAEDDRSLRESTRKLVDELRSTAEATITVTVLPDGNHELRLMQPIDVAGVAEWGVFDRTLGPDAASQNQAGWWIRYTVRDDPGGGAAAEKQLVRQIVDENLVVQRERVLAQGLRDGDDVPPGFSVVQQGDVWEVSFSTEGETEGTTGIREVFHVRARN